MKTNTIIIKILKAFDKLTLEDEASLDLVKYEAIGISERDWSFLIQHLLSEGLIDGYREVKVDGAPFPIHLATDPRITIKGRLYLEENTLAKKAIEGLKTTKEIIPFI